MTQLTDSFGRTISYLRLSLTDRCDFRCTYCMAEHMQFLPKADLLTFEELERVCDLFIARGVRKIRVTGGEPLVRKGALDFIHTLGTRLKPQHGADGAVQSGDASSGEYGLDELTLTTNGSQLQTSAAALKAAGVKRINVSIDTLDRKAFASLTRRDQLPAVLDGLMAAKDAGLKVKLNTVALKGVNEGQFDALISFCGLHGFDLTLIEVMPMGDIGRDRLTQFLPLSQVREDLATRWTFTDTAHRTGGPARYAHIAETGTNIGFISPLTQNFCEGCNRVRLTCTGKLYMCLGQDGSVDFREALRSGASQSELNTLLDTALAAKPKSHDFAIAGNQMTGSNVRHMSVTGG